MPTTRCITSVSTVCSVESRLRLSWKQAARRRVRPSTRSVAPSSNAPASLVMAPPSKDTTTGRPSAGANANRFGLHCVGIGEFLCLNVKPLSQKNFRSIRAPMHLTLVRDAGYAVAIRRDPEATLFHAYNDGFYAIVYFSAVPRGRPGMPKTEIFPEDRAVGEKIAADHAERLEQYKRGQAN